MLQKIASQKVEAKQTKRYLAACAVCYSGARLETNRKREAEEHATHHMVMYGHDVTVIDRKANHPTPRKEG